jgi:DnaJ-class molecular chaperone
MNEVKCPRCNGKAYVDNEDIRRLGMELSWSPGLCRYCNGKAIVDAKIIKTVSVLDDPDHLKNDIDSDISMNINQDDTEKRIKCPRCNGKGNVEEEDIKKFGKEELWIPGPCRYCKGETVVTEEMIQNSPPEDLTEEETKEIVELLEKISNNDNSNYDSPWYDEIPDGCIKLISYAIILVIINIILYVLDIPFWIY